LILKGVSPGAALVFLLVGPATNVTSLSVLFGLLGKRATAIYLFMLSLFAVISGLLLDMIYESFGIQASAIAGQAGEVIPYWLQLTGALIVIVLSLKPLYLFFTGVCAPKRAVGRNSPEGKASDKSPDGNLENECRAPS
jgi:hypothetical protein